jgi:hypothetical protein
MGDQVSYPYETAGKITGLYLLIAMFLDSKLEDKIRILYFNVVFISLWMEFWFVRVFPKYLNYCTLSKGSHFVLRSDHETSPCT